MTHPSRVVRRLGIPVVAAGCAAAAVALTVGTGAHAAPGAGNAPKMSRAQSRALSGFASFELGHRSGQDEASATSRPARFSGVSRSIATPGLALPGCPVAFGDNVSVSRNCVNVSDPDLQGRGQAQNETAIAQDPSDPRRIVAGYNDYRRGDSTCGPDFSSGASWQDVTLPDGFVRGTTFGAARQYFQASGDPSIAWDTKGDAFFSCLTFQRGQPTTNNPDVSSGIYVFRSTATGGASWTFPGRPVAEQLNTDPSGLPLLDKPYITVDNHSGSPFQDRIYVSYTVFATDGSAKIYGVYSDDYGETFSAPVLVSGTSTLCPRGVTAANSCDNNQFSQPFTGTDGALYVVFDNYNAPAETVSDNHDQVLIAKSTDGGKTFGPLVKVADYNDLPDCATYQGGQDAGVACVPEKGSGQDSVFRAANYPSAAVNPTNPSQVVVTFASYVNKDSNPTNGCAPAGVDSSTLQALYAGVKSAGACNNKILVSVSNDAAATFTGTTASPVTLPVVGQNLRQSRTDQFWQWAAFSDNGTLAVSYFDRQYGDDETTGSSDVSLSSSTDLVRFATERVTSSPMPLPTQFPDAQGNSVFYGDYSGLSVAAGIAHPLWMDTRNVDLFNCPGTPAVGVEPRLCTATEADGLTANDQRAYTAARRLPTP
jgi:hypothetical protein